MLLMPPPNLQPDETIIKHGSASWHGYSNKCLFTLTNKRLIFKMLLVEYWFPLSRLKSVSGAGLFLSLQFDNGFSTTASVTDAGEFVTLIEQAKVNAPEMAYQIHPRPKPLLSRPWFVALLSVVGIVAVFVFCMLAGGVFLYLISVLY
jgi:hypothetical protein